MSDVRGKLRTWVALAAAPALLFAYGADASATEVLAQAHEGQHGHEAEQHDEEGAGHSHAKAAQHDGSVVMTEKHHFELVFAGDAVKVYGYDKDQKPISLKGASGSASMRVRGGSSGKAELKYHAEDPGGYLEAHFEGLGKLKPGQAKITFAVSGLPGAESATFTAANAAGDGHAEEGHGHEEEGHGDEEEGHGHAEKAHKH